MKLNKLSKFTAISVALLASISASALEPGVYKGVEVSTVTDFRTNLSRPLDSTEIEITVTGDGHFTTNSPFLSRNGLSNGQLLEVNGMFHFSDSEDELGFAQYPEDLSEILGFEGIGLFTTAGRTGAQWDIQLVSTDVPAFADSVESKLTGNWNVNVQSYRFPFNTQGYIQLSEDGSFDTNINGLGTSKNRRWVVDGDNLILKSDSGRGSSQAGISRTATRTVQAVLELGNISEQNISINKITGRYIRPSFFRGELSR